MQEKILTAEYTTLHQHAVAMHAASPLSSSLCEQYLYFVLALLPKMVQHKQL